SGDPCPRQPDELVDATTHRAEVRSHGPVRAGCEDAPPVRRENRARQRAARVATEEGIARQSRRCEELARATVPEPRRPRAGSDHPATVRTERCRSHWAEVAAERLENVARADAPDARVGVVAGGDETRAIRAELDIVDGPRVPPQHALELAAVDVPEPRHLVARGGREQPSVGAESRTDDGAAMSQNVKLPTLPPPHPPTLVRLVPTR